MQYPGWSIQWMEGNIALQQWWGRISADMGSRDVKLMLRVSDDGNAQGRGVSRESAPRYRPFFSRTTQASYRGERRAVSWLSSREQSSGTERRPQRAATEQTDDFGTVTDHLDSVGKQLFLN